MHRRAVLIGLTLTGLAACSGNSAARIGADGLPLPQVYQIGPNDVDDIQFRMLDSVNALRRAAGVPRLATKTPTLAGIILGWSASAWTGHFAAVLSVILLSFSP